jgi:hypothetical protein
MTLRAPIPLAGALDRLTLSHPATLLATLASTLRWPFPIPLETDGPIPDHGINPANLGGRRRCRARRRSEKSRSVPERRHNVAKFIQLETQQNKVFHVNVDRIASIWPNSDSTDCKAAIYTTNGQMLMVLEAVQQIMEKIKQANASQ